MASYEQMYRNMMLQRLANQQQLMGQMSGQPPMGVCVTASSGLFPPGVSGYVHVDTAPGLLSIAQAQARPHYETHTDAPVYVETARRPRSRGIRGFALAGVLSVVSIWPAWGPRVIQSLDWSRFPAYVVSAVVISFIAMAVVSVIRTFR